MSRSRTVGAVLTSTIAIACVSAADLFAAPPGGAQQENQPPTVQTSGVVVRRATSLEGAVAVVVATATDPDGDEVTFEWQFGDQHVANYFAAMQFPLGASIATVVADDQHGHQVQGTVTVHVLGAIFQSGDVSVHPPAVYEGGATKRPGFIPDVRFDLTAAVGDGVATLNIQTQMQPAPPASLQFGSPPYIYEIAATTTATAISVCIDTTGMTFANRAHARLFFHDGGVWNDVTSNADPGSPLICGGLPAFGSVAIFTPTVSGSGAETLAGTGLSPDFTRNPDGSVTVPDGGLAIETGLLNVDGTAIDRVRNVLYVSDFNMIRRVDLATGIITIAAGTGAYPDVTNGAGGVIRLVDPDDQRIRLPSKLVLDAQGRLYIAGRAGCRVLRLDPGDATLTRVAGDGYCRSAGDGGPADQASVIAPSGLAFDAVGNLFIADSSARVVRRVDTATGVISTVAGDGTDTLRPGQPAKTSGMTPVGVAVGQNGDLYVVQGDGYLLRVDAGGDGATTGGPGELLQVVNACVLVACAPLPFGGDGQPVALATFDVLEGIATEPAGSVLVTDGSRIRRIEADANGVVNGIVSTVAGYDATTGEPAVGGSLYLTGEDFALSSAISLPQDVVVDPAGGFIWADHHLGKVRKAAGAAAPPTDRIPPTAALDVTPRTVSGPTLTLAGPRSTDLGGVIATYRWIIPDAGIDVETGASSYTIDTSSLQPLGPGAYIVTLIVTDDSGNVSAPVSVTFNVLASQQTTPVSAAPLSVAPHAVNDGPGDQTDPHVDKDLMSYTDLSNGTAEIRYFRFSTGVDARVPTAGYGDTLSDVSEGRITLSRQDIGRNTTVVFDVATGTTVDLEPDPHAANFQTAIGHDTVAATRQYANPANTDVVVFGLSDGIHVSIDPTPDFDGNAGVSPDGNTIVWERCTTGFTDCDVFKAERNGGRWVASPVAATAAVDLNPDTDGTWIVYESDRPDPAGNDIYFQPIGGGVETALQIPGIEQAPTISQGVIAFEHRLTLSDPTDIYLYDIATNALYQVTSTPTFDEVLSDISVLDNGDVRVVWSVNDAPDGRDNIRAATLRLRTAAVLTVGAVSGTAGNPVTLNATLTRDGVPQANQPIALSLAGQAVGTALTNSSGVAMLAALLNVAPGSYPAGVRADFAGSVDLLPASATAALDVARAATSLLLEGTPNPAELGHPVTLRAAVASTYGVPFGEVLFSYRFGAVVRPLSAPVPIDATGVATLNLPGFFLGDTDVRAEYADNAVYVGSQATTTMTVTKAITQTSLASTRNPSLTTGPPIFHATIDTTAGILPTGRVEFASDGIVICRSTVFMRGLSATASCGGATLALGSHVVTATYLGTDAFASSDAPPVTQVVQAGGYFRLDLGFEGEAVAVSPSGWVTGNSVQKASLAASPTSTAYVHEGVVRGGPRPIPSLGGAKTVAIGVDEFGRVGGSSTTADGATHVFLFDGATTNDHHNPLFGGLNSRAAAMNAGGTIVGVADTAAGARAFIDLGGGALELGTLPGGTTSAALAIGAGGHIVGVSTRADGALHAAAFAPSLNDLGTLGGATSVATAVNDAGEAAGFSDIFVGGRRAFLHDDNGNTDLSSLLGTGDSAAIAINNAGDVLGTLLDVSGGAPVTRGFLYRLGSSIDLGLPAAVALNNAGEVVSTRLGQILVHTGGEVVTIGGATGFINPRALPVVNATAMNDEGRIAGSILGGDGISHAVVWIPVAAASIAMSPVHGRSGASVMLNATLTDSRGPVVSRRVYFRINDTDAGSADTDGSGLTSLSTSLADVAEGVYPNGVEAWFVGDEASSPAATAADLMVDPSGIAIVWPQPETIVEGTPLDATQLNATANLPGTFVYAPPAGTVLPVGADQPLSVTFTPDDPTFGSATATAIIDVTPGALSVTLLSPRAGAKVFANVPVTIRWQAAGGPSSFNVELSRTETDPFQAIPACTNLSAAVTSCQWTPAAPGRPDARIRVIAHKRFGAAIDTSGPFTISAAPPALTVTSPNSAVQWGIGSTRSITWTHNLGAVATVRLELSRDGGASWETIATNAPSTTANSGQFEWEATGSPTVSGLIRATWTEGPASDTSNVLFAIESPRITVNTPDGGERWVIDSSHTITWSHNLGISASFSVDVSRDDGTSWTTLVTPVAAGNATLGRFGWLVAGPTTTHARMRVRWLHFVAHGSSVADESDSDFHILSRIQVRSPDAGNQWVAGTKERVTWDSTDPDIQAFDIDTSVDGGATWAPALTGVTGRTIVMQLPSTVTTQALIRVSPTGRPDEGAVSGLFSLIAPRLTIFSPNGGNLLTIGRPTEIRFGLNGGVQVPISEFKAYVSTDSGQTWRSIDLSGPVGRTWLVAGPATAHGRIRVTWLGGVADESDSDFRILSRIQVRSPDAGNQWVAGTKERVTWDSTDPDIQAFDIETSVDGGATWAPAPTGVTGRTIVMQLPSTVTNQALIRVSPTGRPDEGAVSGLFSLIAPRLTIFSPNGGEAWPVDTPQKIQIEFNMGPRVSIAEFKAYVSLDSGQTWRSIDVNDRIPMLTWQAAGPITTHARVRVTWLGGIVDESDGDFTIASRIQVTAPNTSVAWFVGSVHAITWTHDYGLFQDFDVDFSPDAGATWMRLVSAKRAANGKNGNYLWTIGDTPTMQGLIRVSPVNRPGDGDTSDLPFAIVRPRGGP